MKKIIALIFAAAVFAACKTPPPAQVPVENPNVGPEIKVDIPELFSPDPDIVDDKLAIGITINHPAPIKDWDIQIQPIRRQSGQSGQRQTGEGAPRQGGDRQGGDRQDGQRRRAVFFEQSGTGTPPKTWTWDGKGNSGEMVQSATDYQFNLSVNDIFDNNSVYEGTISVDVLVRREGDILRIIVPSIVFPPDSSDFRLLNDDDRRANARVLMLIARVLNKFDDYAITVEGHANPTTPPGTPERTAEETGGRNVIGLKPLSEARASAVIDALVANNNIKRERLTAVGMGGTRTVADYDDDEENWKNRRVEFILRK